MCPAAVVVRRDAVGAGFAPELRVGEDGDLCLRLHRAGWRMRYLPDCRVGHSHRTDMRGWLAQRVSYGSSAAQPALRHPGQLTPMNAAPWSAAVRGTAQQLPLGATRHYWPAALLAAAASRRARVLIAAAVIEGLADCGRSGARLNQVAFAAIRRLDDLAYGAGLWRRALRARTIAPLIPRLP